jgi:hypothetical protein
MFVTAPRHGSATPLVPQHPRAFGTVALDRRSPLDDLMASLAFEESQFQPLTRSHGVRKHDLAGCRSTRIQYTAGSRPAEPSLTSIDQHLLRIGVDMGRTPSR